MTYRISNEYKYNTSVLRFVDKNTSELDAFIVIY